MIESRGKHIDLSEIMGQTIEEAHVFDVHLGETLVPYATLEPLKAVLPLKQDEDELPEDGDGIGGVSLSGLERRMRERWQTVNRFWEENKGPANKLSLLGRLDYHRELSAQLEWRRNSGDRPIRVVYSAGGQATASLLRTTEEIIDNALYWLTCETVEEAHYLLAIINSEALYEAAQPLMSRGQFGARNLKKLLWKLPIPEYDADNPLHAEISAAGKSAAAGAERQLTRVRAEREESGRVFSVTVARRELRKWLRGSDEGMRVEVGVGELLGK